MKKRSIGRFIVVDPALNQGAPTFRGTDVPVAEVLDEVAQGTPWEAISDRRQGRISPEAIAEAIRLAGEALATHARVPPKDVHDAPRRSWASTSSPTRRSVTAR